MDVSNLASGVIGALLGVGVTVVLYFIDRRHRAKMAARAVFLEATRNQTFLKHLAESSFSAGPMTDAVYWANLPLVCSLLTMAEMATVGAAYIAVPGCERLRSELLAGRRLSDAEHRVFANCHNSFIDATVILGQTGRCGKSQLSALG